ncbi:MAG: shikimate dehydrogenase [Spirulinaceae cyanobacterium]
MTAITGKTQLLGIIGHPVEHSLSPVMQNAAIAHLGVDAVYVPFPVHPQKLKDAIAGFEAIGVLGFNATIPHKQAIIEFLSELDPAAAAIGAVNTVLRIPSGWYGTNTDVTGFIAPLFKLQRDWSQIVPVVLGNGGAARAVVAGCVQLGCPQIAVVGRNREKLTKFKQSWQNTPFAEAITLHSWDKLPALLPTTQLLVNTTPIGMSPHDTATPVDATLLATLPDDAIAYDLIYTPRPTQFLHLAQQQGKTIIDGTEMLVQQGAAALQLWLQQPVPDRIMRQALLNAL